MKKISPTLGFKKQILFRLLSDSFCKTPDQIIDSAVTEIERALMRYFSGGRISVRRSCMFMDFRPIRHP